ncbi:MAG: VWA domain-containing protein [Candidatus Kariarchaeaceae archaeon]
MLSLKSAVYMVIFCIISASLVSSLVVMNTLSTSSFPTEIEDNAENKLLITTTIQARQIASQLGRTESVINAMSAFAEQIWTDSSIPDNPSFYHDESVLNNPPTDVYYDEIYERRLSHLYSGYKIAPTAFEESYQDSYLTGLQETENPLSHVNSTVMAAINRSAKMDTVFRQLYEAYSEHVWLYMGYEFGFHRSFPWHGPYSRTYDPRTRPWYIGAVTGAKDAVIIMDVSGSMEGAPLANTKTAMKSVLSTLGPKDRFTVLSFSSSVKKWDNTLQIASPSNIEDASSYIDDRIDGGNTDINSALLEGLKILEEHGTSDRTPMLIFMTDGEATSGITESDSILSSVATANVMGARMFVFGLGTEIDQQLLLDLGSQNDGGTVFVFDSEDLTDAMNLYYKFFTSQIDNAISWSWPYVDASGWGIVITASKAVTVNGTLLGVVGADLTLNSLISTLVDLQPSDNGYNFIFDTGSIALIHPSFTDLPIGDWQEDEVRVPISSLESSSSNFNSLVDSVNLGLPAAGTVQYGNEKRVVAMAPIGETSMHLASVAPILEFLDPTTITALKEVNNSAILWLGGCISIGTIAALVLVIKFKEDFH